MALPLDVESCPFEDCDDGLCDLRADAVTRNQCDDVLQRLSLPRFPIKQGKRSRHRQQHETRRKHVQLVEPHAARVAHGQCGGRDPGFELYGVNLC